MTDYTDLMNRLNASHPEWYGNVPTIYTDAAEAIKTLVAERDAEIAKRFEGNRISSEEHREEITKLTAERDAALEDAAIAKANGEHWSLAYSKWVKTDLSAKKLIEQDAEIATLKSALREAKDGIQHIINEAKLTSFQYELCRQGIATINEALK